ncbi:MAG: alpha/beta hydrolase [Alphaproteobacteria bacterium]
MRNHRTRFAFILVAALTAACAPRLQSAGPFADDPIEPRLAEHDFITADGLELPLRRWLPPVGVELGAVVLALHGFNDYSNAFAEPAEWLRAHGIAVYAYDQRGFGAGPEPGMWAGTETLIADLRAALARLRARHPGVPLYVLGESMGGAVVIAAWGQEPLDVDGVILAGPAVRGRAVIPFYQSLTLWLTAHSMPWLKVSGGNLDITPSDNIEMLRALALDPLVIKETRIDALWGLVDLMDRALEAAPEFDARALILYGARDEIIPPPATVEFLDRLPAENGGRRVAIYLEGYHMLLRDLRGEVVWRDMAAWMNGSAVPLPSGADQVEAVPLLQECCLSLGDR